MAGNISNAVAAQYGFLVMHAMDMYRVNVASLTPEPPPRLAQDGWTLLGHIVGNDHLPFVAGPLKPSALRVCYGYVAVRDGELAVAIRGTDGLVEWVEDAEFLPMDYERAPGQPPSGLKVEQGFWSIYATMSLIPKSGAAALPLCAGIVALVQATPGITEVTVAGHSLGGPLATYLALDLARSGLSQSVSGCFFASPHPGNQAFVACFDKTVTNYRVFNYILDIVPRVPYGPDYAPLPKRTVLKPSTAEASIKLEIGCNHHVICYCAMLDYEDTQNIMKPVVPAGEAGSATCILGPEIGRPTMAKLLLTGIGELMPV